MAIQESLNQNNKTNIAMVTNTPSPKLQQDTPSAPIPPTNKTIGKFIHLNPQSKGGLGKTFECGPRTSWLDYYEIPWLGYDFDDRHRSFHFRYPDQVKCLELGNAFESKSTCVNLLRSIIRSPIPLHIIDTRAQADALLMNAFSVLNFFELCREEGIKITFFLFTSDDFESMNNFSKLFQFGSEFVNYIIVKNPLKTDSRLFIGSPLEKAMLNAGAKIIELPAISPATMSAMRNAEGKAKRGISLAEFASRSAGHLDHVMIAELQWTLSHMYEQYDAIAHLLLPHDLAAKIRAAKTDAPSKKKSAPTSEDDFGFNFSDPEFD